MLTKFAVTNYRSFEDRIEFDLEAINDAYEFNTFAIKNGVIKNGIVYGKNGSGKTNFGLAIFDIVNHLTQKNKDPNYYANFTHLGHQKELVRFEYTFKFDKTKVFYEYAKNSEGSLIEESLTVDGVLIFSKKDGNIKELEKYFPILPDVQVDWAKNSNYASIINFIRSSYPLDKNHYLLLILDFVDRMLFARNTEGNEFMGLLSTNGTTHEYIIKNNLIEDFEDFLKEVSGQDFKLLADGKSLLIEIQGEITLFNLIESTGTHSLTFLYFWYKNIEKASFVFIDEFDAFYHFDVAFKICQKLFGLNCQVFLSSHDTFLLTNDLLRPDCNFILDKNCIEPLYKCTDKELRFGHDNRKTF